MKKIFIFVLGIFLINLVCAMPNISNISIEPENPGISDDVKICVEVSDESEIRIVRLNLRCDDPLWNWGLVMDKEENKYCKTLSPLLMKAEENKIINYYIYARNSLGEITETNDYSYVYQEDLPPEPECGNGIVEVGEMCDDGELNGFYNSSTLTYCSEECRLINIIPERNGNNNDDSSNKNSLIQFCEVDWKCSDWSGCSKGIRTRECYDNSNCDQSYNKPLEEMMCQPSYKSYIEGFNYVQMLAFILIVLFCVLILMIVVRVIS